MIAAILLLIGCSSDHRNKYVYTTDLTGCLDCTAKLNYVINKYNDSLHIVFINTQQNIVDYHFHKDTISFSYEIILSDTYSTATLMNPAGKYLEIY